MKIRRNSYEPQTSPRPRTRFESFASLSHFDIMFNSVFIVPSPRGNFCKLSRTLALAVCVS